LLHCSPLTPISLSFFLFLALLFLLTGVLSLLLLCKIQPQLLCFLSPLHFLLIPTSLLPPPTLSHPLISKNSKRKPYSVFPLFPEMATLSVSDSEAFWLSSANNNHPEFNFPSEFPYDSDLLGGDDVAADEDDFFAGLTRRLNQQLSLKSHQKKRVVAGSPESTLSGLGSMSVSSNGSPNGDLSPTDTAAFGAKNDTWDLIYAAADQVAKLKMNGDAQIYCKPTGFANRTRNPAGFYSFDLNAPKNQYQQFGQDPLRVSKQQCPLPANWPEIACGNRDRGLIGYEISRSAVRRPAAPPPAGWTPLQNPNYRNQTNTAFLGGGSGAKRECAGTGVFLPRRYGFPPPESRKKPTPVLLPAKVVHALNLNFIENEQAPQPRFNPSFSADYAALLARRNAVLTQLQNKRAMLRNEAAAGFSHETRLPQDWTY
ncbi:hypothetical protein LINGRAHAP2_LOCUS25870, partial [Linum grandiflorum]